MALTRPIQIKISRQCYLAYRKISKQLTVAMAIEYCVGEYLHKVPRAEKKITKSRNIRGMYCTTVRLKQNIYADLVDYAKQNNYTVNMLIRRVLFMELDRRFEPWELVAIERAGEQ